MPASGRLTNMEMVPLPGSMFWPLMVIGALVSISKSTVTGCRYISWSSRSSRSWAFRPWKSSKIAINKTMIAAPPRMARNTDIMVSIFAMSIYFLSLLAYFPTVSL